MYVVLLVCDDFSIGNEISNVTFVRYCELCHMNIIQRHNKQIKNQKELRFAGEEKENYK